MQVGQNYRQTDRQTEEWSDLIAFQARGIKILISYILTLLIPIGDCDVSEV